MAKRWRKVLGYLIGLGIFLVIIYFGGFESVQTAFSPRLDFLLLYFLANLLLYVTGSIRWGYLVNALEGRKVCSQFDYFLYFISGRFFGQYVSQTGGDILLRPGLLKKASSISMKKGIFIIFWEKLFDLIFVLSILVPAIFYLLKLTSGSFAVILGLVMLVSLLGIFAWKSATIMDVLKRLLLWFGLVLKSTSVMSKSQPKFLARIENLDSLVLLETKAILWLMVATFVRQIFVISRHYFLVAALGLSIPLSVLIAGAPVAQMSLLLAFTPGALGILEGGWYAVFSAAGISPADSSAFLLGQRVYSLIATSLIFLLAYLIFGVRQFFSYAQTGVSVSANGTDE